MGSRLRHYCALMKKNWIIWKRTLAASLCELFCPVALMAILAIARALVTADMNDATSKIDKAKFFYPIDYLSNTNLTAAQQQATAAYSSFLQFHGTDANTQDVASNFLPVHCTEQSEQDKVRPIIAYAGTKAVTSELEKNLKNLQRAQQQKSKQLMDYYNSVNSNPAATDNDKKQANFARRQSQLISSVLINYQYRPFQDHNDILNYITNKNYMRDDDHPGVCFGFTIQENSASDYEVRLIFNDHATEQKAQNIPTQINPPYTIFDRDQDTASFELYTQQGYSYLQNWIANEILQLKTKNENASIAMSLVPFKTDKYVSDQFGQIMNGMLPFFMLLMYILPVYRLISNVVSEKESKARESMKMMGLGDFSYWLSWFTYYLIVVTIITILCIIILLPTVFKNSDRGIIFLYFWVFGISLFGMCVLIQAFFSRARVAAITGTLFYFGSSFINAAVADPTVKQSSKNAASLIPTIAVSRGAVNLGLFETNGMGLTYDTINEVYQNYRFSDCLILMTISFVIMFWLGIYLENVLPSAYGLRKPWYFCFTPSYWMGANSKNRARIHQRNSSNLSQQDLENSEDFAYFEAKQMKRENFEPPSRDLIQQEHDNKILKINDLKKIYDNGFQAVKGVSIKMYSNQIFALLGHNGAGKTTTISMLTGLVSSSAGYAEVFGLDLFHDMNEVRQFLGVCPQHDILFDLLTPEEHLDIFCDFKGVDRKLKKEEIRKMMIDVDVIGGKDIEAKNLSGGNRRKLSVAIALIGGSKLVLLDEPTSGMDLSARRKLWNMLKNYKNNRIIILTTHYMDEADILGDRIGIMTGGQLICLGSSLFLKNRFGVGYNLTMVKKSKEPNTKVGRYLEQKIGEVKKLSEVSSEITYQIPTALSHKFKDFFTFFDQDLDQLDIRSYGISVTTLEEVFLRVGHGDEGNESQKVKEEIQHQKTIKEGDQYDDYSIAEDSEQGTCNVFLIHMAALFRKRLQLYKKNYKGLIIEVLIPVLLVLIGFGFSKVQFFVNSPDRNLTPSEYPLKQRLIANLNLQKSSGNDIQPKWLIESLPDYPNAFDATFNNYSSVDDKNGTQEINRLRAFDNDVFDARLNKPYRPSRYTSYYVYEADKSKMNFKVATFINITSQDVSAFYPQFMYEAILKQATGNPNFKYSVKTVSFPVTQRLKDRAASANGIFIVFVVSIGFALIPAAVISFILNEREKNLKHMQVISGLSLPAYWLSNLCFDIIKGIIPSAIVIGLMYAFDLQYDYVFALFLLFPVGVIPFTYVTSFAFASENIAQTVTIFAHFVIAGIGAIVTSILRFISSTQSVGDALQWVFRFLIPSYNLTDSIMYQATKSTLFILRPSLKMDDLAVRAVGGDILLMCMHCIFYSLILILIESRTLRCLDHIFDCCRGRKIAPKKDLVMDEDVLEEEERVENAPKDSLKVRVDKFRKVYTGVAKKPFLAVEKTSFGLDYGECFALLGVNGAGKTTTFKSLTGGITPTSGSISICGMDIERDFAKIRKLIGYCPQHDAIFDLMTVEEHLYYYARIKGIKQNLIQPLVEKHIREMNLEEHRTKLAGSLSGGNKRKLSVAMCVIGNPPIILLDEPSAGMDPEARRFMWSVVAKISQQRKKSAVILTTHSMEEAEALSTKMGIMVKGGIFKCFGSAQHIKSKFGTGYEIETKIRKIAPDEIQMMAQNYGLGGREEVDFEELPNIMRAKMVDEFLIKELRVGGMGNDLVQEAEEHKGQVSVRNFINWLYIEICGMKIVEGLVDEFGQVEILEHYNDYFKMRVPRGDKSIGFVFSFIENKKEGYKISEYSASQTTLEQIFQTFANLKIDADDILKFVKKDGMVRKQTLVGKNEKSNDFAINADPMMDNPKGGQGSGKKNLQYF